jgi:predicted ATPase
VIRQIDLEMFKCFELLKLPLSPLTLLSGTNASGKSTVLQSLVLLHQTILDHEWSNRLHLNGSELNLGTVTDVVDKVHGRREFGIAIIDDTCTIKWNFQYGEDKVAMSAAVASVCTDGIPFRVDAENPLRFLLPNKPHIDNIALRLRNLTYLTAERVGPRDAYQVKDPSSVQVVGPRGDNAVGMLYQQQAAEILPSLVLSSETPTLLKQVSARMQQFFPKTAIELRHVPEMNSVTLGLRTSDATSFHRPVNVGFGLTQVLPIIVAALAAKEGDLLLIENPEVHLHPAGQALMGQFLAEVAAAGVQVLVESHSDHLLNGIRRAVKSEKISPSAVALHFFKPRDEDGEQVTTPILDSTGNIDHWPAGFFDQLDKDLNYFAGWGD